MSSERQAIIDVIAQVTETDATKITPEMDLVADLGVDSPKALELLVEMEERLGIEISDEEAEKLDTVADLLAFVGRAEATT